MKRSRKLSLPFVFLILISSVIFMTMTAGTKPLASPPTEKTSIHATCWCVISKDDLRGFKNKAGVLKDLTSSITQDFNFQTEPDQEACRFRCGIAAKGFIKDQGIAAAACAANADNLSTIRA